MSVRITCDYCRHSYSSDRYQEVGARVVDGSVLVPTLVRDWVYHYEPEISKYLLMCERCRPMTGTKTPPVPRKFFPRRKRDIGYDWGKESKDKRTKTPPRRRADRGPKGD